MSQSDRTGFQRRSEARRLIEIARANLTAEPEQIAAIYLDHAIAALRELEHVEDAAGLSDPTA